MQGASGRAAWKYESMSLPKERSLGESWFNARAAADRVSDPPDEPVGRIEKVGQLSWAVGLGLVGGASGGVAMMFVAREFARRLAIQVDVVRTIGHGARALFADAYVGGLVLSAVVGALVGMLMGALMRYTLRVVPRVLAAALLAPVLWTLLQAFVLKSFAPSTLGALPFGPMIAGAAVYGICVALIPPPRRLPTFAVDDD